MKKQLVLLGLLLLPAALFAQGTIQFANTSTTQMTTNSGPTPPPGQLPDRSGVTTGVNSYLVGLYIAPQGTADPNAFTLVGTATNGTVPVNNGRFNGGIPFAVPGNTGQTIAFQIRAWSFFAGATYEEAALNPVAYIGVSGIGQVTPVTISGAPPAALFGTGAGQLSSGFVLTPNIPEPSSIALGLLGLGAIALFRRRK
jgi:hypothetical protein